MSLGVAKVGFASSSSVTENDVPYEEDTKMN